MLYLLESRADREAEQETLVNSLPIRESTECYTSETQLMDAYQCGPSFPAGRAFGYTVSPVEIGILSSYGELVRVHAP